MNKNNSRRPDLIIKSIERKSYILLKLKSLSVNLILIRAGRNPCLVRVRFVTICPWQLYLHVLLLTDIIVDSECFGKKLFSVEPFT